MNQALPARLLRAPVRALRPAPEAPHRPSRVGLLNRHSRLWLVGGVISGALLFFAFVLIGSDSTVATILCAAWVTAWSAVAIGGGFQTITGWFAFFPLFHFLLFPLPLKVLMWDPVDKRLEAPLSTSLVMLLFFAGIFFAALLCRSLKIGANPICPSSVDPRYLRSLAWVCFLMGTAAYFAAQFGVDPNGENAAGGSGFAHSLALFTNFSIPAYIFYAWRRNLNVWKRPTFWLFFVTGIALGILASTKTGASQPIVYVLAAMFSIHGFRSVRLLIGLAFFGAIFVGVIYPVMHYGRSVKGARTGSFYERLTIMGSVTVSYLTDPKFRADMKWDVDKYAEVHNYYLPESTGVFDRFMMMTNTGDLVAGVDESGYGARFHGFELLRLGFEIAIPRALYPAKPDEGSADLLADAAGTPVIRGKSNPTWGLPATLYYSFGLPGVFVGTFLFELMFYVVINVWFGSKVVRSAWFCLAVVTLNMTNSCSTIDSLVPSMFISFFIPALIISKFANLLSDTTKRFQIAS